MSSDKFQIERKIRLLEDSLKSGIIDQDEFDRSKARLDAQLASASDEEQASEQEQAEPDAIKTSSSAQSSAASHDASEESTEKKDQPQYYFEEKSSYKEYFGEKKDQPKAQEPIQQAQEPQSPSQEKKIVQEPKQESPSAIPLQKKEVIIKKDLQKQSTQKPFAPSTQEQKSRLGLYIWIALAIALAVMLLMVSLSSKEDGADTSAPQILCSDSNPCGAGYECINAGTAQSSCEQIKQDPSITLTIVTDETCALCDTTRVQSLLRSYFPSISSAVVDSSSDEGKALISAHDAQTLPLYVVDAAIEESKRFDELKTLFTPSQGVYVLKQSVSAAPYYRLREETPLTLALFFESAQGASVRALRNLAEFQDAFPNAQITLIPVGNSDLSKKEACANDLFKTKAVQYIVCSETTKANCAVMASISEGALSSCANKDGESLIVQNKASQKELSASTPSFLINNIVRVSGVQSADSLREKFCALNEHESCGKELSTHLV